MKSIRSQLWKNTKFDQSLDFGDWTDTDTEIASLFKARIWLSKDICEISFIEHLTERISYEINKR